MQTLTLETLCSEAEIFSHLESQHPEPVLYGVTDGKAVGTYLEQKFKLYLKQQYDFVQGNSASGIDFPGLLVDDKTDNSTNRTATLKILHTIYVSAERTGDFQMTRGIRNIIDNEGNQDDLIAFMLDRNLPVDEIEVANIASEILVNPPLQGFLTISNALHWRLQYGRVIERAGKEEGIMAVYKHNL